MSEDLNTAMLNKLVQVLLQALTGANAFGVPSTKIIPGKSFQHSIGSYVREADESAFTSPIAKQIHGQLGKQLYQKSLRLLGYSDDEARRMSDKDNFVQDIVSFGSRMFLGSSIDTYGRAAYRRAWMNPNVTHRDARQSFADAGKSIIEGIGNGDIQGYSIDDAFKVASMFTRQGRYDFTQNSQRFDKIRKDLQDYAEGINNLRDGLQGSLEEVLDSFEKLTGSSATVTHKDRFNAITRSMYNAIAHGGVTPQLLASSIATQHAYLQGLGVTQATSATLGTINANILANGVSVEGASQNAMNEALTRQSARWVATGKAKELTAAFGWWADRNGKERNADNFQYFKDTIMRGNISDTAVRDYIERNNISGEYIHSARNRRNMASPYIYTAFHEQNVQDYERAFNSFNRRNSNILSREDMWLTDDELTDKLMEEARKRSRNGKVSSAEINRITKLVEDRRNIIQNITNTTDADNGLNILRNQRQTVAQQRMIKASNIFAQGLGGKGYSVGGMAGLLNEMISKKGYSKDTVGELLGSFLGTNVKFSGRGAITEQDIKNVLSGMGYTDPKQQNEYLQFVSESVGKMSNQERDMLFNDMKDKQEVTVKENGKDKKVTWGSIRKNLLKLRATGKKKEYREALQKAKEQGFITEEGAWIASYAAENDIDFSGNPEAYKHVKSTYELSQKIKDWKNQGKDISQEQADKISASIQRLRAGKGQQGDEDAVRKAIKQSNLVAKERQAYENTSDAKEKKKAEEILNRAIQTQYERFTTKDGDSVEFWLKKILEAVQSLVLQN